MKTYLIIGHLLTRQPLATCSKDLKDTYGGDNKPLPVPFMATNGGKRLYFPATGIRAALRRSCRDVVRNHVITVTGNEKPFSLDEHYLLTLGGVKGSEDMDRTSVAEEARWRGLNPLLSLFGAGAAGHLGFVEGHLHVGNAIAEEACEPVSFSGARTDDFYRDKSQLRFLSDDDVLDLIARSQGNKSRASLARELKAASVKLGALKRKGVGEAEIAAAEAEVSRLEAQVNAVGAESGAGTVTLGMPLAGYEAIPQGVELQHTMRLVRSNEIELGCLLTTLATFAAMPILGAHKATGCGEVSGKWEVFEVTSSGKQSLGNVTLDPYQPLNLDTPGLRSMVNAFGDFLDSGEWNFGIPGAKE